MIALPAKDEVIVWQLSLDLPSAALARCRQILSQEELARGEKLLRSRHRRRHLAAWGQLRWLLGTCLDIPPQNLRFGRKRWGKPYLIGADISFNMAHSADRLLIAITWQRPVGVDVEVIRPLRTMASLAQRCFATVELEAWQKLAGSEQVFAFFRFWTLKEAFVKADGRGLGLGVNRCVFGLEPLRLLAVPEECGRPADWQVLEVAVEEGYQASLCVQGEAVQLVQQTLSPDWLSGPQAAAAQSIEDRRGAFESAQRARNNQ